VRRVGRVALVALALAASGCGIGYVVRAGYSEARILWRREPITSVLARPDLDPGLRERLELVLAVRAFARDGLGLRVGESFATFADVDGDATVWVVSAAYRDRLEAYTWWFPVVGRVPYKGFFDRGDATALAGTLEADQLDVDVRSASAFSTLGWFADPLLSTTARADPVRLAETVIHELFHATLYLPGEATFNESAATFVGHRGAIAFFCDGPGENVERCGTAIRRWDAERAHGRVVARLVRRLRALYASGAAPQAIQRQRRVLAARAAATIERRHLGDPRELSPPNNARLLAVVTYETDLDVFDGLVAPGRPLRPAIAAIVARARGAADPFAAVRAIDPHTLQTDAAGLDSTLPWRQSHSPWTSCWVASRAGSASSDMTSRTVPTCTARGSCSARAPRIG